MCALFGKRAPQGTVAGKGEYRAPACSWPTVREHLRSVCWPNSHAPTADLWLANGNEVPTKIISPESSQGHTQELNKEQKKGDERSERALVSDVSGWERGGPLLQGNRRAAHSAGALTHQHAQVEEYANKISYFFIHFLPNYHYARL